MIEHSNGTLAATGGTDTIATISGPGAFVLLVDLTPMIAGDAVALRANVKVLSGSTSRQLQLGTFADVQVDKVAMSDPVPAVNQVVFTLTQTAGSNHSYDWSIIQYDG